MEHKMKGTEKKEGVMKSTSTMFKLLLRGGLVLIVVFTFPGLAERAEVAQAASFTVNSTADRVDANPGDGICDDGAGNCTLRAAIMEANVLPGPDTILLPAGIYTLSIPGREEDAAATGDLDITGDLTITGAGDAVTIVDGNQLDRVFDIHSGSVAISGITVRNGNPQTGEGGGIQSTGTLILSNSSVRGNRSLNGGGGIINGRYGTAGTLTVINSSISGNFASGSGSGGGIKNMGPLTVTNSTIDGNSGGGIWHFPAGTATGTAEVVSSTISNNDHGGYGGGGVLISYGAGSFLLTNSTVSGNTSSRGAGIYNGGVPLTLSSSTITGNTATNSGGGIYSVGYGTITSRNTIIAGNTGPGSPDFYNPTPYCYPYGPWNSQGYNLIGDNSGNNYCPPGVGDQVGTGANPIDPLLGPLQDNGGPTLTHALLEGSPAIDAGNPDGCTDVQGNILTTDQRGWPRSVDGNGDGITRCDIGAFEFARGAPLAYVVTASVAGDSAGGLVSPSSQTVSHGATATFTVTTNTGFTATVSEGTLSDSTWTIPNIASTHTVTVTFTKNTYTMTASVAGDSAGGLVSPSSQTISHGATATFTVTTNTGFTATVSEGTLSDSTWTIANITSSRTVTVTFTKVSPIQLIQNLIGDVRNWNLPKGTEQSLTAKLDAANKSLEKGQKNAAINQINAFINEVNAQRGKNLTDAQADDLIKKAKYIIDVLNL